MSMPNVRQDCRHYLARTSSSGDVARTCRVGAAHSDPFTCPEGCLFFEGRAFSGAGWTQAPAERMTNTADGLAGLSSQKRPRRKKNRRK